jgi:hypothetical protein
MPGAGSQSKHGRALFPPCHLGNPADHKPIRPRKTNLAQNRHRIEKIANSVPHPPNSSPNNAPRHGRLSGSPEPPTPPCCPGSFPEAPVPSLSGRTSPRPAPLACRNGSARRKVRLRRANRHRTGSLAFPGRKKLRRRRRAAVSKRVLSVPGAAGAPMQTGSIGAAGRRGAPSPNGFDRPPHGLRPQIPMPRAGEERR